MSFAFLLFLGWQGAIFTGAEQLGSWFLISLPPEPHTGGPALGS